MGLLLYNSSGNAAPGTGSNSRYTDEEQLRALRYQENILLEKIVNHEGTMKDLILKLADSMAARYELLDPCFPPEFALSQISTEITRALRAQPEPCPVASCVRQYLPVKYKNANMARECDLIEKLNTIIEHCGVPLHKKIEQCSHSELETLNEYIKKAKHLKDDIGTQLTSKEWEVRAEAVRRGINLGTDKLRDQISARDYRYEIPDYFGLEELNNEVILQGNRLLRAQDKFINQKYPQCPAVVRQDAYRYAHCFRVWANVFEDVIEDKWSGEDEFWYDREFWKEVQSSHKSGNSTFFNTTLCAHCSKDIKENPKDFHRMKYWRPSPTGFICDNCGGTKIYQRENSREQVGDKNPNVLRDAADLLNHAQYYSDIFIDWRKRFKSPEIYARKAAISEEFRKAAFGKEKIVVPRKQPKKSAA